MAAAGFSLLAAAGIAYLMLSPERRASGPVPPGPRVVPLQKAGDGAPRVMGFPGASATPASFTAAGPTSPPRTAADRRHEALSFHEGGPDHADADRASDPTPEADVPPRPQPSPSPPPGGQAATD